MHGRFIRRGAEFAFKKYMREETIWIRQDNVVVFGSGFVTQDRAMSRAFSINGLVASVNGFESVRTLANTGRQATPSCQQDTKNRLRQSSRRSCESFQFKLIQGFSV